ncbi:MAG TPA: type IIL restriction-modification enzyme MmeI, partial [Pyrinomonadaceae bacterium]
EIVVLKQLRELSGHTQLVPEAARLSRVDVDSCHGIESEELPAQIAAVALWLAGRQADMELSASFGLGDARPPLRKTPDIVRANALRLDWNEIVSRAGNETETRLYILGNPPFVGKKVRSDAQNKDMELVFDGLRDHGVLDYACAWHVKAADFILNTRIKVAFVSTNSITQGEQVGVLWNCLREKKIKIHFAHRAFKWTNETRGQAAVHCVIVGFAAFDTARKHLYDYHTPTSDSHETACNNINPYLVAQPDVIMTNRKTPLSDVPPLVFGNMPNDGGNLLFGDEERADFLAREPRAEKFMLPLLSAHEFINGENRWCLWLEGARADEWRELPEVLKRVRAVRAYRLKSKRRATLKLAGTPHLFGEIRQPATGYVLIPLHSSENRKYVPMAFFPPRHIVSNSCSALANATLYHFAVLTSNMHMVWLRQICGRIKSDYRYSNNLVYNNFPFPLEPHARQKAHAEEAAQTVLDARAKYPVATLARLYDPDSMPRDLLDAHRAVDSAVEACYGPRRFKTDLGRLELLFALYRQYTAPLDGKRAPVFQRASC